MNDVVDAFLFTAINNYKNASTQRKLDLITNSEVDLLTKTLDAESFESEAPIIYGLTGLYQTYL